ncbi:MAG: crossover junction endodeoxyribonuclease RuvC [Candidatus Doudnabacteria bacterium RIFCSPHIGHO2_02_FULL_46_11]|uniref:Crossover junction endodeoxyribonuclease RuvC n=1 Tax=Candidatus Doudnabacteria bacterium RIFCSPHIGHO2_02_FULL_46_11 TaxID=1817832 RepID=A0A1F5P8A1_9BACT|nr:MAG: crossover junction endodeoxyribonuclease RuvC [Candidatus Doudnabacteria bacterium RIFCSPHIGHO2_02_FULL_46_11]
MVILGIDPGTATIGFGAIETISNKPKFLGVGVITTPKTESDSKRLETVYTEIKKLIKKFQPEVLVLEKIYFSKNIKTAIAVAQARGVIMLAGQEAKLKILEVSPQEVKLSVAGYGAADKKQVQKMVKMLLNLKEIPKPDDAADALAAALSAINRRV